MPILTTVRCAWHAMIAQVHTRTLAYAGHQKKTDTHTTRKDTTVTISTSDSSVGLARQSDPFAGMWVAGWITSTQTVDGLVHYGPFDTKELALEWGKELINVEVYRVFVPSYNAG